MVEVSRVHSSEWKQVASLWEDDIVRTLVRIRDAGKAAGSG